MSVVVPASPASTLAYGPVKATAADFTDVIVVGEKDALGKSGTSPATAWNLPEGVTLSADQLKPMFGTNADAPSSLTFYQELKGGQQFRLTIATISAERSRTLGPVRSDLVTETVGKHLPKEGRALVILVLTSAEQVYASALAVARALSLYSKKTVVKGKEKSGLAVRVVVRAAGGNADDAAWAVDYAKLGVAAAGIRQCARLVDMPASELHTDAYVEEVRQMVARLPKDSVKMTVIRGEELRDRGFGGLWGVGKAGPFPPALVVLSYAPAKATKTVAMVGKGIVFDTGGLSIKSGTGMKTDMGGSAAVVSAFEAAVLGGFGQNLHALLCLAENSVDSVATRPDDILHMYSGKTVEINNTDAEGRLVLADGVAYATKHLAPDVLLDMATLTGAQLIATGQKHAAVLSNDNSLEAAVIAAGKSSGDWAFPILYAPELFKSEFKSEVADMKNSVKNRMNAQSSCAGHFIEDHLHGDWKGRWAHIDIAGPATIGERGSGFGVALLLMVLEGV